MDFLEVIVVSNKELFTCICEAILPASCYNAAHLKLTCMYIINVTLVLCRYVLLPNIIAHSHKHIA